MLLQALLLLACLPSGEPPVLALIPNSIRHEDALADRQPEIKEAIGLLNKHVHRQGKQDAAALQIMTDLSGKFPGCGPKDQASIARAFGKCLAQPRKDLEQGLPNNELYLAAGKGLGAMGDQATEILLNWIKDKRHRDNMELQKELVLSMGKTRDPKAVPHLIDLLKHRQNKVIRWAAVSLREFKSAGQELRKEAFLAVQQALVTAKNTNRSIAGGARWKVVAGPMKRTLIVLSGTKAPNVEAWQRWWNKNKKKDWGEGR